ncbi:unnamed protein product [Calypogeia fissa]
MNLEGTLKVIETYGELDDLKNCPFFVANLAIQVLSCVILFRRRLTADGPRAAYDRLRQSQRNEDTDCDSGVGPSQGPYVVRIASDDDSDGHLRYQKRPQAQQNFSGESNRARQRREEGVCRDSIQSEERRPTGEVFRRNSIEVQSQLNPQVLPTLPQPQVNVEGRRPSSEGARRTSVEVQPNLNPQVPTAQPQPQVNAPSAYDKLYFQNLKKQGKDQQDTIQALQKAQSAVLHQMTELPRFCRWEAVAKVLTDIVSAVFFGSGPECDFYPSEDELIPKILEQFNIQMDMRQEVETFLSEWGKGGSNNLQAKVSDNIRDRRGSVLRTLREEFYLQLGLPRPRKTELEEVRHRWKSDLLTLKRNNAWRISHRVDSIDPWGSDPVHHSIARVMQGLRYNPEAVVTLNLKQAGFFSTI